MIVFQRFLWPVLVLSVLVYGCSSTKMVTVPIPLVKDTVPNVPPKAAPVIYGTTDSFATALLTQHPDWFQDWLQFQKQWQVQFIYTQINRSANGIPLTQTHSFNLDSTLLVDYSMANRLPLTIMLFQQLPLYTQSHGIDLRSIFITEPSDSNSLGGMYNNPTTSNGTNHLLQCLQNMWQKGDRQSFNRIYEIVGQANIQAQLNQKELEETQIAKIPSNQMAEKDGIISSTVKFLGVNKAPVFEIKETYHPTPYYLCDTSRLGDTTYKAPVQHRPLSLEQYHHQLLGCFFPLKRTSSQRFSLSTSSWQRLFQLMAQPVANGAFSADYVNRLPYLKYAHPLLPVSSDTSAQIISFDVAHFNGNLLMDAAYVIDANRGIEYFLTVSVRCNAPNSTKDEQQQKGLLFMKRLSTLIYQLEYNRNKSMIPTLSDYWDLKNATLF